MFIKNYGLFWRADEIIWNPGRGMGPFQLLGRLGTYLPGLWVADFRYQRGIYILYGNHGPYYVGLTKERGLGQRLKEHLDDVHRDQWDRFSWFGFRAILSSKDERGSHKLRKLAEVAVGNPAEVITDVEALLTRAMGPPGNTNQTNFREDQRWTQVKKGEVDRYMERVR